MKIRNLFIGLLALSTTIVSCNDKEELDSINITKGTEYTAKINLGDKINIQEEAKGGAALDDNDMIGIQIKETEGGANKVIGAGLFNYSDIKSGLSITLKHGFKYSYESTLVKNGKDLDRTFAEPFKGRTTLNTTTDWKADGVTPFDNLSAVDTRDDKSLIEHDRWYCPATEFTADYNDKNLPIALNRKSVKLQFEVSNINDTKCDIVGIIKKKGDSKSNTISLGAVSDGKSTGTEIYGLSAMNITSEEWTIAFYVVKKGGSVNTPADIIKNCSMDFTAEANKFMKLTYDAETGYDAPISITLTGDWTDETSTPVEVVEHV